MAELERLAGRGDLLGECLHTGLGEGVGPQEPRRGSHGGVLLVISQLLEDLDGG